MGGEVLSGLGLSKNDSSRGFKIREDMIPWWNERDVWRKEALRWRFVSISGEAIETKDRLSGGIRGLRWGCLCYFCCSYAACKRWKKLHRCQNLRLVECSNVLMGQFLVLKTHWTAVELRKSLRCMRFVEVFVVLKFRGFLVIIADTCRKKHASQHQTRIFCILSAEKLSA